MDSSPRKPFLGGFRDARTSTEFHNASTATPAPPAPPAAVRFTRDAQTASAPVTRSGQAPRAAVVQTYANVRGIYLGPADEGRHVTARPYEDSAAWLVRRTAAALRVQCAWRCAMARARVKGVLESRAEAEAAAEAAREAAAARAAAEDASAIARRTNPRTAADFAALYDEVEEWRAVTTARIKATVPAAERTAAFSALLAKETDLIKDIDRLRAAARAGDETAMAERRLKAVAQPNTWPLSHVPRASRTPTVAVDTPLTTRAAELARLHAALGQAAPSAAVRTEVLLHVKFTVAEFDCTLTREIIALIDRELDQLARGRPESALAALRLRIQRAFFIFADSPEFNPEAARAPRVPVDRAVKSMPSMLRTTPLPPGVSNIQKHKMSWQENQLGEKTLQSDA